MYAKHAKHIGAATDGGKNVADGLNIEQLTRQFLGVGEHDMISYGNDHDDDDDDDDYDDNYGDDDEDNSYENDDKNDSKDIDATP